MASYAVGVDVGGTKILTALVSGRGQVVQRHRVRTPQSGPEAVVGAIVDSARAVLAGSGVSSSQVQGVGIGAPGPLDPTRGIVFDPPNLPGWSEVPLAEMLSRQLRTRIQVENDANAAAVGEWWVGAGVGIRDLIYITVGTGIGGGIILGGSLIRGVSGTAGEIGHMTIDLDGPACLCGSRGCLEVLASGPAIARMAQEAIHAGRTTMISELAVRSPDGVTAEIVTTAARAGDGLAQELLARAGSYLGVGVANLLNVLNPAMVVLGGGVSKAGELLFEPLRRTAQQRAFKRPAGAAAIAPAALGADAGVVGAAAVVFLRREDGSLADPRTLHTP